jgi:hypothetical protein
MEFPSSSFLVFGCGNSCLLQVNGNGNMWCYICVSNVKVVDEPSSCFGVFDDLWQRQAQWGALVEVFEKWVCCDGKDKRLIVRRAKYLFFGSESYGMWMQ